MRPQGLGGLITTAHLHQIRPTGQQLQPAGEGELAGAVEGAFKQHLAFGRAHGQPARLSCSDGEFGGGSRRAHLRGCRCRGGSRLLGFVGFWQQLRHQLGGSLPAPEARCR